MDENLEKEIDDIVESPLPERKVNWYLVVIVSLATALVVMIGAYFLKSLPGQQWGLIDQTQSNGRVKGNKKSRIYHVPGCKNYDDISPNNIEWFNTEGEAVKSGYRKAQNCF